MTREQAECSRWLRADLPFPRSAPLNGCRRGRCHALLEEDLVGLAVGRVRAGRLVALAGAGKVDGDAMKGSAQMRSFEIDWTAKRAK